MITNIRKGMKKQSTKEERDKKSKGNKQKYSINI